MAQILVRNLPDATKEALRTRAARHGRSMEAEARSIIVDAVLADDGIVVDWLGRAERFHSRHGGMELPTAERSAPREIDPL